MSVDAAAMLLGPACVAGALYVVARNLGQTGRERRRHAARRRAARR